ncbi:MAG: oxidoreductase [Microbacterium sp.]|jgi:ferredoxin-NADP reductase|uniref:Oxidoreductase n=1 Tax=Microbacterium ginsengisoli TaxID=400772 RepID=A0A0F0LVE6_9MICO|nr:PDR/VanB family oxidoreductase [Microbacterium ginsengisoli]KJL35406.1 Phenoxybenzoate dioxygenase subunit beta [Microbacterium ginsengisoli]MAL07421.1 oxidoreductase [Microbacterium sp.]MBN9209555.1 oxidoreductase [Microbacterium ginsengisoli]HAN23983.1 oxidoreductase [Microbacterium ginsengisoli]
MNPIASDVDVRVVSRTAVSDDLVVLELAPQGDEPLPAWEPGAHVDVLQPGGLVRQYSLVGPAGAQRWRLGVLREPDSRGGSTWMLDQVAEGTVLRLAGPRNHFRFDAAAHPRAVFLAGGIGITPIAAMADAAASAGIDYELHYAGHEGRMILVDELRERHGDRLVLHVSERGGRLDLEVLFGALRADTGVWCCGPLRLVDAAEQIAGAHGVAFAAERFEPEPLTAPVWDGPFEVELEYSGMTVEVAPDRSVLDVLEESGVFVLSSCREGTCGTCETPVISGEIDHRDSILSPSERERSDVMYVCVSRAACPRIVLGL